MAPFNGGGPNGVGGITLNGTASSIKYNTDSKGVTRMSMTVSGPAMSAQVVITLPKGTNRASALIKSNFRSSQITLEGKLMPSDESTVFKGNSI